MTDVISRKFSQFSAMLGKTPLLCFDITRAKRKYKIYAKVEYYSITGSVKDRVAFYILQKAYERGEISPTDIIAEATSGNTGIAFSALGRYLGHRVLIYMPDWMSRERISLMESFGAEVHLVSREEGGFLGSIRMTEELAEKGGVFLPRQFSNPDNTLAHFYTTGEEISQQLASIGVVPDAFVAGVGTGGTVMGVGKRLQQDNPNCEIHPLEPLNSPTLSTGYKVGKHRIQGISDEFIPDLLKLSECDSVVSVDDIDSIIMAQMVSRTFGVGIGVSGGANLLGAIRIAEGLPDGASVVTVFADDNKKYLSTDYSDSHQFKEDYMTCDIQLDGVSAVR